MKVDFSRLHRLFYPQVPLVLGAKVRKRVSAMPVVAYASVSDSPALVAVACNPQTFTYKLCSKAGVFSLSVLDAKRLRAMEELAKVSGAAVQDKLLEVGLPHSRGKAVDVPVIDGSVATIECSLHTRRKFGDHVLLVGKVEACYSEYFSEFWEFERYHPILYTGWRGGMTTFTVA